MINRLEMIVIGRQGRDMHHAFNVDILEFDKQSEPGYRSHHAAVGLPNALKHVLTLEPGHYVTGCLISPALGNRYLGTYGFQPRQIVRVNPGLGQRPRSGTHHMLRLAPGADYTAHRTMIEQVGITANRRGKVGIGFIIQAKMANIVRTVLSLTQRAQHDSLDQVKIRPPTHLLQQAQIVLGRRQLLALVQAQAQGTQKTLQLLQLGLGRTIVNAIQAWQLVDMQEIRHRHIGAQHAFFNQLMSIVTLGWQDLGNLAIIAKHYIGFTGLEVDGATTLALPGQRLIQVIQLLQVGYQCFAPLAGRLALSAAGALKYGADLIIGQTAMGADYCLIKFVIQDSSTARNLYLANHCQTVNIRVERAQTVGQCLWQHRNHALGKVDRVATLFSFSIQRRADLHIMRDISNSHIQLPATLTGYT